MADLNALIAQGYQFQPLPDPFAQYAKRQQLDLGEQTNQLNQMKMQEAQAAGLERNALRQFLPGLNEGNRNQLLGYGATGQSIFKTMAEGDKERRLAEQAVSQTAVNKSNILKNVVAQTRDAVAGIDPNDAPSYMTLRTSVLSQYPDLEPYMPAAWDANVKQRLIVTAASVLEGQKPNIAPLNPKDYTPESLQAYLKSRNPASLIAATPKAANVYAPIIPKDYTPESLKAYGLSGDVSDLIPVAAKTDKSTSLISQIDPSKFTPASVAAFNIAGDYSLLVPVAAKADKSTSLISQINADKFTPASVAAFNTGGDYSLLVPVATTAKTDRTIANVNPNDFTPKSLDKYLLSGNYSDLVPVAKTSGGVDKAPRTQQVTLSDGSLGIVNMDTGAITRSTVGGAPVKGKPSAFAEKAAAQKVQVGRDLTQAITELTAATKDGGLIDQSTGSGVGRLVDVGAGFIGQATPGAIAIGKLQPISDIALKMVPRFEGPQSNADTTSYKQAAGQLADPTLPVAIRKEAGKIVLRLMIARKDQFTTVDMATGAAPAATGVDASNPLLN
jgi:hypothetical protein